MREGEEEEGLVRERGKKDWRERERGRRIGKREGEEGLAREGEEEEELVRERGKKDWRERGGRRIGEREEGLVRERENDGRERERAFYG